MIQAYQFFNEPVPNSSIIVPMAHEMLKHQSNLQHGSTTFTKPFRKFVSVAVHNAHQIPKQWHRKLCRSIKHYFFADVIFAKGMQLKINVFSLFFFVINNILCWESVRILIIFASN